MRHFQDENRKAGGWRSSANAVSAGDKHRLLPISVSARKTNGC